MTARTRKPIEKPPLLWSGILFAFAANLLFVTMGDGMLGRLGLRLDYGLLASFVGPLIAGFSAARYVKLRGGIHAFIGGFLSVPVIAFVVFSGLWQPAILAGAICGLSGAVAELQQRRRA